MCLECRSFPCDPRCPNAPDPPEVYTCEDCGDPIIVGDEYVEFDEKHYHLDCFQDAAVDILLEHYGAVKGVAEVRT